MLEFGSSSAGLTGSVLISHPNLVDPNFRKTVIFISNHDADEGAFGLVLNRPALRTVGDVLGGKPLGALLRLPVFLGGPVEANQLIFSSFIWHPETDRIEGRHHLDLEQAQESMNDEHTIVRAFVGYAGWGKGQLEGELEQSAWLVGKQGRDIFDELRYKTLWREMLSGFGPWFKLMSEAPDDLSAN